MTTPTLTDWTASPGGRHEVVLGLVALAVVPVLLLEEHGDPQIRLLAKVANWVIWIAFVADFVSHWLRDRGRPGFFKRSWFDIALIVLSPPFLAPIALQGVRSLRVLRAFRLVRVLRALAVATLGIRTSRRALRHHHLHYVLMVAAATVGLGAVGIFLLERGTNQAIRTFDDALWWAVVTATTVGYGDVSPMTGEGRIIAVMLMIVGIGVISIFTASIASFMFERDESDRTARLEERLTAIENKLDVALRTAGGVRSDDTPTAGQ